MSTWYKNTDPSNESFWTSINFSSNDNDHNSGYKVYPLNSHYIHYITNKSYCNLVWHSTLFLHLTISFRSSPWQGSIYMQRKFIMLVYNWKRRNSFKLTKHLKIKKYSTYCSIHAPRRTPIICHVLESKTVKHRS